jgi:hypothetical protein
MPEKLRLFVLLVRFGRSAQLAGKDPPRQAAARSYFREFKAY